jgi:segregation and condensation protein B
MSEQKDKKSSGVVAFVQDPYGLSNVEVNEAQMNEDELDLDADIGEDSATLASPDDSDDATGDEELSDLTEEVALAETSPETSEEEYQRLAQAVAQQVQEDTARLQALSAEVHGENEAESRTRLAREIAEDEALEREMAAQLEQVDQGDEELRRALPSRPEKLEDGSLDLRELESCLEALLFMSDKPLSAEKLRELLGPDFPHSLFQEAITSLRDRYQGAQHGIELVEVGGGVQFRTKPGRAALAKKLAKVQTQRLSGGAMETLAIVAYRQPVMKDDIDKIRGVDSSHFIRGLLDKKLIRITGRSELPGRPMVYSTSPEFLELFGLKSLDALPSLRELEQMVPGSQSASAENEDPRVKEMRRLVGEMSLDTSVTLAYDPKEDENILQEIRAKVNAIPTSSPYLDAQKEAERIAKSGEAAPQQESGAHPSGT